MVQIRACELNMSSMLPPIMVKGIAERSPATMRMTIITGIERTRPMIIQQMALSPLLTMYMFFRPNVSDHGGNKMVPATWPSRNLFNVRHVK